MKKASRWRRRTRTLVFVVEPVTAITDPAGHRNFLAGDGLGVVEAYDNHGALDSLEAGSVGGVGGKEGGTGIGPVVAVVGRQGTDRGCGRVARELDDAFDLSASS
jgi:hypothetical protein